MKERPILFSSDMVRAILEGRKTQTRRVIKPQELIEIYDDRLVYVHSPKCSSFCDFACAGRSGYSAYGQPGDRLWVKETWATHPLQNRLKPRELLPDIEDLSIYYRADENINDTHYSWRPSIFMPRWASRITLEITGVRVERLQDINPQDCLAEGIEDDFCLVSTEPMDYELAAKIARTRFLTLWDGINAKRDYGWNVNPWVFVIEFTKI